MTSKEISVIIQGPVFAATTPTGEGSTARAIASVRRALPEAEVILSTWEGSDTAGLEPDRLLSNPDPGPNLRIENGELRHFGNLRRQLLSTREGLAIVARPYAIKLRADAELRSTAFLDLASRFPKRSSELRLFSERLIIPTFISWNPDRLEPRLFHLSDLFFAGPTVDLQSLFSVPLPPVRCVPEDYAATDPNRVFAHLPIDCTQEQYLHITFLRQHVPLSYFGLADSTPELRSVHDLYIANNLILADFSELGLYVHKFSRHSRMSKAAHYTHGEWQHLYRRFCDTTFQPHFDWTGLMRRCLVLLRPIADAARRIRTPK